MRRFVSIENERGLDNIGLVPAVPAQLVVCISPESPSARTKSYDNAIDPSNLCVQVRANVAAKIDERAQASCLNGREGGGFCVRLAISHFERS